MSDRSPEDELFAEAIKFGRSFQQMLRLYAQAGNWLDKRRIRKQISLALREQRRTEETKRSHQLDWTQQMVDRYRVHAQTVAQRATDPTVDHQRRYQDSRILAEHGDFLRSKIIANPRLTPTEQGIALDGLDAVTTFPHLRTGRLFDRAHKVKGIDALHYRAQVHRTKTSLDTADRQTGHNHDQVRDRAGAQRPERYAVQMTWSDPRGWVWSEFGSARTVDGAAEWVGDTVARSDWMSDTTVELTISDTADEAARYRDYGEPREVAENLLDYTGARDRAARRDAAAQAAEGRRWTSVVRYHAPGDLAADQVSVRRGFHDERGDAARWVHDTVKSAEIEPRTRVSATLWDKDAVQPAHVAAGSPSDVLEEVRQRWHRYTAQLSYFPEGADRPVHESRGHVSEAECADWTRRQLDAIRSEPGTDVEIGIYDGDRSDHDPVFRAQGPKGMVADEIDALRDQHQRRSTPERARSTEPPDAGVDDSRLAEVERQLTAMAADRDRLSSRVETLQRGLDAVTADRDEIRRTLSNAESQIESLKNRNQRLAAEIGQLRDRPNVDAVAAERDRYRRERDEAVAKLAQRTPAQERYGSKARVAFDKLGNTERWTPEPATTRDGTAASGETAGESAAADPDAAAREKYGWAVAEQMSADFVKAHGDVYDETKMQEFARDWLNTHAENTRQRLAGGGSGPERNGQSRNGIERSR
ncbi:hypothetical protein [Nocardia vulneris]|uniref:Uncharacterized protein n=1 Tax=Nocardia vulneris TaxID=1141657 RepID=A0ABR4Z5T8_9NOCA|nr:hypothetical protein [Nocardia vulneris]KIA60553.1 hypothetical protein FG87_36155 [Nocardia vulneris]